VTKIIDNDIKARPITCASNSKWAEEILVCQHRAESTFHWPTVAFTCMI